LNILDNFFQARIWFAIDNHESLTVIVILRCILIQIISFSVFKAEMCKLVHKLFKKPNFQDDKYLLHSGKIGQGKVR